MIPTDTAISYQSTARRQVLVVVPPNSNTVLPDRICTVTRPQEHSDWSDFLCLGALSIASALESVCDVEVVYVDGTITPFIDLLNYISESREKLFAVCVSVLTANYEAGVEILRHVKNEQDVIRTIVGNDHFTALPRQCMEDVPFIDYGFMGNEVVSSVVRLVSDLLAGQLVDPARYPGCVMWCKGDLSITPMRPEPVFTDYNYRLIDHVFPHSSYYQRNFQLRIAPRIKELLEREVTAGVPIEIGRGCIKFSNDDACSFCSIQYGGLWRNQTDPATAWASIRRVWDLGYDYMYVTADELPLTFNSLLLAMEETKPDWWTQLSPSVRPVLVGYARADGVADDKRTRLLVDLGFRQVMIGMDAGSDTSLAAMNKPLGAKKPDLAQRADRLYAQNWAAIKVARRYGLLIRAGFVIGHIGMTPDLLEENVQMMTALITAGRDIISAVDVEVLSPQPGSLDFRYLTNPSSATRTAARLGLPVSDMGELERAASIWRETAVIIPELAMRDYASVLMPGIDFEDLASARRSVRSHAKSCGVVVGE